MNASVGAIRYPANARISIFLAKSIHRMTRPQLRKLLSGTGVDLSALPNWFERDEIIWGLLVLVHGAVLLGFARMFQHLTA
ncbi:hypothetical protein [Spirosoma arcticum]